MRLRRTSATTSRSSWPGPQTLIWAGAVDAIARTVTATATTPVAGTPPWPVTCVGRRPTSPCQPAGRTRHGATTGGTRCRDDAGSAGGSAGGPAGGSTAGSPAPVTSSGQPPSASTVVVAPRGRVPVAVPRRSRRPSASPTPCAWTGREPAGPRHGRWARPPAATAADDRGDSQKGASGVPSQKEVRPLAPSHVSEMCMWLRWQDVSSPEAGADRHGSAPSSRARRRTRARTGRSTRCTSRRGGSRCRSGRRTGQGRAATRGRPSR